MVVVSVVVSQPVTQVGHEDGAVTTKVGVTGHALSEGGTVTVFVEIMMHKGCGGHVCNDGHFSVYLVRKCLIRRL
jgi:hypothetical protein